ncbi:MAG TPA: hypothetical protein VE263_01525 [Candidatus Angelobacter sp.]|nr:hypothetical protein [Candidatus Angelobacter sp.]
MNATTTDSGSTIEIQPSVTSQDDSRCQFRFSNGKRCRFPGSPSQAGFCSRHFHFNVPLPHAPDDSTDLSADLLPELSEFSSAVDIRQFLARLLVQVTRGRVSSRRAWVLACISSQLLHSNRAVQKEDADKPVEIIWDLPRPKRD